MARVLGVDEEALTRMLFEEVIKDLGHEVVAVDMYQGLDEIRGDFDLVVIDTYDKGRAVLRVAKQAGHAPKLVIDTSDAHTGREDCEELKAKLRKEWGVERLILLPKPFDGAKLEAAVRELLSQPVDE